MFVKATSLIAGSEDGWLWSIVTQVRENCSFHSKGTFYFKPFSKGERERTRGLDRYYMKRILGEEYMKNKQIHHNWKEDTMQVLTKAEHTLLHRVISNAS